MTWPRNGEKRELGFEPADGHCFEREEVEKQRAITARGERGHLALGTGIRHLDVGVDLLEIRRLAAFGGTVIDDLHLQFFRRLIDNCHWSKEVTCSSAARALPRSGAVRARGAIHRAVPAPRNKRNPADKPGNGLRGW